jgi:hypothetical protein
LIIFKRNNSREVDQYRKVFDSVTIKPGVWSEVTRLAAVVAAEKKEPKKEKDDPTDGNGGVLPKIAPITRPPRPGEGITPRPTGSPISPTVSRPGTTSTPTTPTSPSTPTNPSAPPTPGGKPPRK